MKENKVYNFRNHFRTHITVSSTKSVTFHPGGNQWTNSSRETMIRSNSVPVTIITRNTAKAMLPPSYHPSFTPCEEF